MISDHLTNDQWTAIAPAVAKHFLGEPTKETDREIRWGRKYSKCLFKASGCLTDFEDNPNRSLTVIELVERELQTDKGGAVDWLKREGYISESPNRRTVGRSTRRSTRPARQRTTRAVRPRTAQKPKDSGTLAWTRTLWAQAEAIGNNAEHPFWCWAIVGDKPGVLHPYCAVPPAIRWTRYRGGAIVAGVFPLKAWGKDGIPKGEPVAVQVLAIDTGGNKRFCLGPNKDLNKCSYGDVGAGVFLLGDPTHQRVNIVEGVADALAVYSREPGAVLATLGSNAKLTNMPDVIDWLCTRETWLYPDNDENKASEKGTAALIDCIKVKSPDAKVLKVNARAVGDDPGEWAKRTPFAEIERYDFEEKSGILFESGLAWGEAARLAVQHFNGEQEQ